MAEPTPTAPPAAAAPLPAEAPATHGKKAQIVAIALLLLLLVGLILQSFIQVNRRAERDKKDAADNVPTVQDGPYRTMDDFRKAQKIQADALAAKNLKDKEESKRAALLEKASGATLDPNPTPSDKSGKPQPDELSPEHIQKVFAADELRRALHARRAAIATNTSTTRNAGTTATRPAAAPQATPGARAALPPPPPLPAGAGPTAATLPSLELARADAATQAALENQRSVAARNLAMLAQAKQMGGKIPPGLEQQVNEQALRLGLDPKNPTAIPPAVSAVPNTPTTPPRPPTATAYDPAGGLSAETRTQLVPAPQAIATLPDSFGEPAQNRAFRAPGAAGPRPGEKLLPTTTIISAVLDMDVMSDYDGNWKAVVQRPVYDVELETILVPSGTRIHGKTSRVSAVNEVIQNRMGFAVSWAIRPDGKRIDFRRAAGVDHAGVAALKDQVDRHLLAQLFGVLAYAVVGLGPSTQDFGANPNSAPDAAVRDATQQGRTLGRNFAAKYLSIVPTVTIRAGTPIKIFLEDDIYVTPWSDIPATHYTRVR